jgi:hypothetical protein
MNMILASGRRAAYQSGRMKWRATAKTPDRTAGVRAETAKDGVSLEGPLSSGAMMNQVGQLWHLSGRSGWTFTDDLRHPWTAEA